MACDVCQQIKDCGGYIPEKDIWMRYVLLLLCDILAELQDQADATP